MRRGARLLRAASRRHIGTAALVVVGLRLRVLQLVAGWQPVMVQQMLVVLLLMWLAAAAGGVGRLVEGEGRTGTGWRHRVAGLMMVA